MSGIRIEIDASQLARVRSALSDIKNGAERAITRALNSTAAKAKIEASKAIRAEVKLSASYVNGKITVTKATFDSPQSSISAERRGVLLTQFPYTILARGGVSVRVSSSRGREKMPSAFVIPRLKNSGVPGIALPKDIANRYRKSHYTGRLPYVVLHAPSVSQVLTEVKDDISPDMDTYLATELDRQIGVILVQHGGTP